MKRPLLKCLFLTTALAARLQAGTITYAPIPATGSDAGSGIDSSAAYTSAVAAGSGSAGPTINGLNFVPLNGSGQTAAAGGITVSAASGSLAVFQEGNQAGIPADGGVGAAFQNMVYDAKADDGSEQYIVLDPTTLTAGTAYDFRLYIRNASNRNRQVNLSFVGDGQPAAETDFFNEDDATTSSGGFSDPNQAYYINYRFTWDGTTAPGVTITQKFGDASFCFYAATNQPATATVAAAAEPSTPFPTAVQTNAPDPIGESDGHDVGVQTDTFYADPGLQKSGHWVNVEGVGQAWQPNGVERDWAPYTNGAWVNSDAGWTWTSEEDYGWATYHYGRWFQPEGGGWYWIPGSVWAPAWVSWRYGGGYAGWAPLPPDAYFRSGIGISVWSDRVYGLGPGRYNFVHVHDLGAANLHALVINRGQNAGFFNRTTNVTNIVHNHNAIFAGGPNPLAVNKIIQSAGGHPVPRVTLQRQSAIGAGGPRSSLKGGVLTVPAPVINPTLRPTVQIHPTATISGAKPNLGWQGLKNAQELSALKAHIAGESKGLTPQTAPAALPRSLSVQSSLKPGPAGGVLKPGGAVLKPGATTGFIKPGQTVSKTGSLPLKPGQTVGGTQLQKNPLKQTESFTKPGAITGQPLKPGQAVSGAELPNKPLKQTEALTKPGSTGGFIKPGQAVTGAELPNKPLKQTEALTKPGGFVKPGQAVTGAELPNKPLKAESFTKPGAITGTPEKLTNATERNNPPPAIPMETHPGHVTTKEGAPITKSAVTTNENLKLESKPVIKSERPQLKHEDKLRNIEPSHPKPAPVVSRPAPPAPHPGAPGGEKKKKPQ